MAENEVLVTELQPSGKMATIYKEYVPGKQWDGEFDDDRECKGFARLVYYEFFGRHQNEAAYYWMSNSVAHAHVDNSFMPSAESAKQLILALPVGTLMRVVTASGKNHSIIIAARTSSAVLVYDCNRIGAKENTIGSETMTYKTFASTFPKILYFSQGNIYNSSNYGKQFFSLSQKKSFQIEDGDVVTFDLSPVDSNASTVVATVSATATNTYELIMYGEYKKDNVTNTYYTEGSLTPHKATGYGTSQGITVINGFWQFIEAKITVTSPKGNKSTKTFVWFVTFTGDSDTGQ